MEEREKIEEKEYNQNKKMIFEKVSQIMESYKKGKDSLQESLECIGIKDELPDLSITMNNKLVELYNQWEETGNRRESYLLLLAINNLVKMTVNATSEAQKIQTILKNKVDKGKDQSLQKTKFFNRFIGKIKSLFGTKGQESLGFTNEEKEMIEQHIGNFKQYDKRIYDYNFKNNILDNLYEELDKSEEKDSTITNNRIEYIAYDLQQLGLKDASIELKKRYQQQDNKKDWKKDLHIDPNAGNNKENVERKNYPEINTNNDQVNDQDAIK